MKNKGVLVLALSAIAGLTLAGLAQADDLCKVNPYTKSEAEAGKAAFNTHCALCHQYNMKGREPGNSASELPDIKLLSASDLQFIDGAGGRVPPLLGAAFFDKQQGKSLAEFSSFVSSAANSFPPNPPQKMDSPMTYFQIAAYVLYRNCGRL